MDHKDHITTEDLSKKFTNQFELVSYAIRLAENMLKTGRDPRVKTDMQNRALQVLEEIATGNDRFDEIAPEVEVETVFVKKAEVIEKRVVEKQEERRSRKSDRGFGEDKPKRSRRALAK